MRRPGACARLAGKATRAQHFGPAGYDRGCGIAAIAYRSRRSTMMSTRRGTSKIDPPPCHRRGGRSKARGIHCRDRYHPRSTPPWLRPPRQHVPAARIPHPTKATFAGVYSGRPDRPQGSRGRDAAEESLWIRRCPGLPAMGFWPASGKEWNMTKWLMFIASVPACSADAAPQVRAKVVGAAGESGMDQVRNAGTCDAALSTESMGRRAGHGSPWQRLSRGETNMVAWGLPDGSAPLQPPTR